MSFSNKIPPTVDLPTIPNGHTFDGTEVITIDIGGTMYTMTMTQFVAALVTLGLVHS